MPLNHNDYPPPDYLPDSWEAQHNNFGGIRRTDVPPAGPKSGGFRSYETPQIGVAAIVDLLHAYQNKHGLNTLSGIINRWAPSFENPTQDLINNASTITGFKPNEKLDLNDPDTLSAVTEAMIRNEFGGKLPVHPYIINSVVNDTVKGMPSDLLQDFLQGKGQFKYTPPVQQQQPRTNAKVPPGTPDYFTNEQAPFQNPGQPHKADDAADANPFNISVPTSNPPGFKEAAMGAAGNLVNLEKEKQDIASTSASTIQNLRNAAEVFSKINAGVTIPAQTELGRWLTAFGVKPETFGLSEPQFAQEAKKAATLAMYSAMKTQPTLNSYMESAKFTSPEIDLEPDAAKNLIANSIANLEYNTKWYDDMQKWKKDHNNNIYGYDPMSFRSSPDNDMAMLIAKSFNSLPSFKGEKSGATIGVPEGQPKPETTKPPIQSSDLPDGIPEGSKLLGKSKNGGDVYLTPDGKQLEYIK